MAKLTSAQLRQFKADVAALRCHFPALLPVRVYRRKFRGEDRGALAHTYLRFGKDGKPLHFVISIDSRLSWEATWMTLLHEWAHAVGWREGHETVCDHDPEWSIAFGRIWQEMIEP